jgi:penicillin-binding protein 2
MKENKHRLGVLAVIVAALFGALMLRLSYLQTVESASLRERAEKIPTVRVPIPPTRGRILDRNGKVLVDNLPLNVVTMDERKLVRGERIPTLNRLVELLDVPFWKIEQRLADPSVAPSESVEIARGVSESKIIYIEENKDLFPGVSTRQTWQRIYPEGALAGHVLGYVGRINATEMKRLPDDLRYQRSHR